jgi:protoporphyrinogen/coproporphyrinogen III oxidase
MGNHRQVIVIGAGISGLTSAFRLRMSGVDVLLIESSDRAGGVIRSQFIDDYLIERGPNSSQGTDAFIGLVEELGIDNLLVEGDPKAPAYVYFNGSLHPVPRGPSGLIGTDLLTISAKLGLLAEPFRAKRQSDTEESVASFVGRRLGKQVAERFVGPFTSGIYAGDPDRLSIQAAFPALSRLESDHGSLVRGAISQIRNARTARKKSGGAPAKGRRRRLCSFVVGMESLPEALASCLAEDFQTNCKVMELSRLGDSSIANIEAIQKRFAVRFATRSGEERMTCEDLVIATPAFVASGLLSGLSDELAELLGQIEYPPLAVVSVAYDTKRIKVLLDGFGFLAAPGSGLSILGCVYNSSLFKERAPNGKSLLTCFVGGARNAGVSSLGDSEIGALVDSDLRRVLGITGDPKVVAITRYEHSIPQYNIGHAERVRRIDTLVSAVPGLRVIGNYLHGVSTGDCIKEADQTARALVGEIFGEAS